MGSLQTEIQKTLNSWGTVQSPVEGSIAQRVFDFVKDNPSCTSNDVVSGTNINLGKISATLLTLYQKGKLDRKPYPNPNPEGKRDTIYRYWTAVNNFSDRGERRVAKKPKKVKALSKADLFLEEPKQYELPRMKQGFNPEMFVQELSLKDAKAVYELLKGYFGD
jgi:hypothetical protein